MYKRVLVPLDQSELAETILPHALEITRCFAAEMVLFHVSDGYAELFQKMMPAGANSTIDPDLVQATVDAQASAGKRYLDHVAERCRIEGFNVRPVLAQGPPARTILQYCEEQEVSLVTMCTHGHSGLKRTFLGSVADEVMRESRLPVLLLRPAFD